MILHLIRHTRPKFEDGTCYGQSDLAVENTFEQELPLIRSKIKDLCFDAVFSSPLSRCLVLAKSLCPEGMDVICDNRLKELNFGRWELKKWDDISHSEYSRKWFDNFVDVACPGGESFRELMERTKSFIDNIKQNKAVGSPLIITHAGVIRAFHVVVNGISANKSFDIKTDYGQLITLSLRS
jgi:alpha-ribazole phosphatase